MTAIARVAFRYDRTAKTICKIQLKDVSFLLGIPSFISDGSQLVVLFLWPDNIAKVFIASEICRSDPVLM